MEESILISTKKILGLDANYVPFDLDIITHINAAFSILNQMGLGPTAGFSIEDETALWSEYETSAPKRNLIKTYVFLKVKSLFDPPTTSYLIDATENQIKEYEWRLNIFRETELTEEVPIV